MKKACYLVLAGALALACLTGCGGEAAGEATPTPSGEVTQVPDDIIETPAPEASPDATPVPENPAAAERDPETEMRFTVEGETETVPMTLMSGEFDGGPAVSLYIDKSRYDWIKTDDGVWYVARPETCGEAEPEIPVYSLEVNFVKGKDADELAPGLLDGYDELLSLEDAGMVAFAGGKARQVLGQGAQLHWCAWIIDRPEGAVTLVLRYEPSAAEGHAQRLEIIAGTIEIASRY